MKFSLRSLIAWVTVWCLLLGGLAWLGPPRIEWLDQRALTLSAGKYTLCLDSGTGTLYAQVDAPHGSYGGRKLLPLSPTAWGCLAGGIGIAVCVWRCRRPVV